MDIVHPEVLLLSDKHDYATDHVAFALHGMNIPYVRLNRDEFSNHKLVLRPTQGTLHGELADLEFEITTERLKSIYFRAPIYLRDIYQPDLTPDEQFSRIQWSAFLRSLQVYDKVFWLNHPQATFLAEVKPFQLLVASRIGFKVPRTLITNSKSYIEAEFSQSKVPLALKTLDPMVLRMGDQEGFIYTNLMDVDSVHDADLASGPILAQEAILPKVDIRVTVIGNNIHAVSITDAGSGIANDWRVQKNSLKYTVVQLPTDIENLCRQLLKELNLTFGGVDLAVRDNEFYFLEVNPTGEWAWLLEPTQIPFDTEIANLLVHH